MKKAVVLVLDSFGIGASEDAEKFGDAGANTLLHIARECADHRPTGPISLPVLTRLGLAQAAADSCGENIPGLDYGVSPEGLYGYAREMSSGKDTPSGHWEIAGVPALFDWGYFPQRENSFPQELIDEFISRAGLPGILGNCHSSGTEILKVAGTEHMKTGRPICYTSADSVFQIAAHEDTFGLEELYHICDIAFELVQPYNIGRVIARPFTGTDPGNFVRTGNRKDIAVPPPAATVLDRLEAAGGQVISVGKIADIYAHQGITRKYKENGLEALLDRTLELMSEPVTDAPGNLIFTNLVDFDMLYGHRRDVSGYAAALEYFDSRLEELLQALGPDDILILAADHGCDPTWKGTDHTREHIPVLAYGPGLRAGNIGERQTFADIGQTLAYYFGLKPMEYGTAFI